MAAITAWLAPLPPNDVPKELPSTVSPTVGILSTYATCRGGSAQAAGGGGGGGGGRTMSMTLAPTTTTSAKPRRRRTVAGAKAGIRARPTRATRAIPGRRCAHCV